MEEKMNNIDANYALIEKVYRVSNFHLKQEINSNGDCFNFESQDCFKDIRKDLAKIELSEKIFPENDKLKRKLLREIVIGEIQMYIELYEQYRNLFNSYDRHSLMFEQYKKFYNLSSDVSNKDILKNYLIELALVEPNNYFESEFYNNIDFVSVDYHYFFYRYACFIKLLFTKNIEIKYEDEYLIKKTSTFIHSSLLFFVYHKLSDILFEPISEFEFISFFNLKNDFVSLTIKKNHISKVCSLIGRLYKFIEVDLKDIWLENILKSLNLKRSTYDSKYSEYIKIDDEEKQIKKQEEMKGDNLIYYEKLNALFDKYNELNEI